MLCDRGLLPIELLEGNLNFLLICVLLDLLLDWCLRNQGASTTCDWLLPLVNRMILYHHHCPTILREDLSEGFAHPHNFLLLNEAPDLLLRLV
jgi:uncharacterized membrane protein